MTTAAHPPTPLHVPPDKWHDSGEMALVRAPLDSMVDVEPYRDSAPALDELLREYLDLAEGAASPDVLP